MANYKINKIEPLLNPKKMAKKAKKQKAGMLKRKKQKQSKKAFDRRRIASRMPQKPSSEKEVQKILRRLPILAYEPELLDLHFEESLLRPHLERESLDPQIVLNLITAEFLADFQKRLEKMNERTSGEMQKNIMVKGMLYSLEHDQMPHFVNPLIVAIYLRSKAQFEGNTLELHQILKAAEDYEKSHMETIEKMIESPEMETDTVEKEELEVIEEKPSAVPPIDSALMESYFKTLQEFSEDVEERMREDVEVFLEEYVRQPLEEWTAEMLDDFLGNWFVKNLHPVVDDLISMQNSLEHFIQFLAKHEKISAEKMQTILPLLQDKETYKQRMLA